MIGHGSFDMWLDNQVLLVRIHGAWNEEEAKLYFTTLKETVKEIIKQPWAMIVYLNDWELGTPETDQIAAEVIQWCMENYQRKVAIVYSPNLVKKLQIKRISVKSLGVIEQRSFPQEDEAFGWLKSEGYAVNHPYLSAPEG